MASVAVISIQLASIWGSLRSLKWINCELDKIHKYTVAVQEAKREKYVEFRSKLEEEAEKIKEEESESDEEELSRSNKIRQRRKRKKQLKLEKRTKDVAAKWKRLEQQAIEEVEEKPSKYSKSYLIGVFIGFHMICLAFLSLLVLNLHIFNHYFTLGVPPMYATALNLKRTFVRHPMRGKSEDLNSAYRVLSSEDLKTQYDLFGGANNEKETIYNFFSFLILWFFMTYSVSATSPSRHKVFGWGAFLLLCVSGYEFSVKVLRWYNPIFQVANIPILNMLSPNGLVEVIKQIVFPLLFCTSIIYQELTYQNPEEAIKWMIELAENQQIEIVEQIKSLIETCKERQKKIDEIKKEKD